VAGIKNALLVAETKPREQRQHFGAAVLTAVEHIGALADFPLAGKEYQDVAIGFNFAKIVHRTRHVLREILVIEWRQEKFRHRKHPPRRHDHRRGHTVVREKAGEGTGIQCRR
jgi:hypothetical protein